MNRSLVAALTGALVLAACGGSSSSAAPPAAPAGPTGTVLGQPFKSADGSAVVLDQARCEVEGLQASATGLALGFGSVPGLCAVITDTKLCGAKANATIVTAVVVRANALATASPVATGTYPVTATTPAPDAQGNVVLAQAFLSRTDATCQDASGNPAATSGTIRIDGIGPNRVTGTVDLTFQDGSHVSGAFDVARCGFQPDVCTALSDGGCATRACVP